ncbi:protein-disulfide reductase DsbD family protein [Pseudaquidulcibacter saccharophilus]|uniref:protein-disulfide reductase DsbD family protein n=1 Tax=Pseudaquidulcibacter saccharophilus TaxID=2831900 RepID=UPI001EFF1AA9|nr:thioredoxin family protein [Pseudaquidulcibacter saccharophilus]
MSLICAFFPLSGFAQSKSQNVEISLLSSAETVAPGESFYIALKQKIAPEWHTYWRNFGDVGDPTTIEWTAPNGVEVGAIEWAIPKRLPYAEFINYGYDGEVILPVKVTVPKDFKGDLVLKGDVAWLECKDTCVPGDGVVNLNLKVGTHKDAADKAIIDKALAALPKQLTNYKSTIVKDGERLFIGIENPELAKIKTAYFFPYEISGGALINHAAAQEVTVGDKGMGIYLTPSMSLPAQLPTEIKGLIEVETNSGKKVYEITAANNGQKLVGTFGQKPHASLNLAILFQSMLFAFFGGIILNLMPCVFPILAMKIFGLTKIAHKEHNHAKEYGVFYFVGVLVTFTILGGLIFALKAFGAAVGWGFQLQSPVFLMFLIALIFAVGFNLLGMFEIGTSLQGVGAGLGNQSGRAGALFSGILAVLVASPCTAPFMGVALGFAATQPAIIGLLVFIALGIGFALPFMVLTFAPSLLNKLPKPGPWLDAFKKVLAIPMFLTAGWLIWVLSATTGVIGIIAAIILGIFSALILHFTLKQNIQKLGFVAISLLAAVGIGYYFTPKANAQVAQKADYKPWSEEAVKTALSEGKIVFVDFTADWCITCKVNESTALKNEKVQQVFKDKNVEFLVADWTKKDDIIARALSSHGRAGVPMYLVYHSSEKEPVILPQLLTPQIVINAVEGK